MKAKKKTTAPKTLVTKTTPTQAVPKTIREQLERDFFKDVLGQPYAPIPKDKTLTDYVPTEHTKWASDFVQMYMDNIYMKMNVQAPKTLANKPVVKILDYLEKVKRGRIFHGWK